MSFDSRPLAVQLEKLSKCHPLYDKPSDRLREFILPRLRKTLGLPPRRYHRDFWALRDVSLEVRQGQTFGIIGRNGAGKSTLLQMLCGTLLPTDGEVSITGRVAALLELGSGFNPEFTGRENVFLNAGVLGQTSNETAAKFKSIEAFADIGDFIDQPVKTYSSGMLVRLAFAVIAHVNADILVIDEALSVGDAFFTQKCMRFLREFMASGTVIFVSHDIGAVRNLCTHAAWLDEGRIVFAGTPSEVCDRYLESQFADAPGVKASPSSSPKSALLNPRPTRNVDSREALFLQPTNRNDLHIYSFDPQSVGHFTGVCEIHTAFLKNASAEPLVQFVGGEEVSLVVKIRCVKSMPNVIVGFFIKDRLGQYLIGDNTCLCSNHDQPVLAGQEVVAVFVFDLPRLAVGTYHITLSAASGSQQDFIQHHWIHEAITIVSQTSSVAGGLIGIPMRDVRLEIGN
ncbi:MAG: ABC transporter ATP-binding protein [Ramlibacter sp.]|nr:ABC transporter ATP-binding protein [Ramlibacter sp.]